MITKELLDELNEWVTFFRNRPIQDPLMLELLRAAEQVVEAADDSVPA